MRASRMNFPPPLSIEMTGLSATADRGAVAAQHVRAVWLSDAQAVMVAASARREQRCQPRVDGLRNDFEVMGACSRCGAERCGSVMAPTWGSAAIP